MIKWIIIILLIVIGVLFVMDKAKDIIVDTVQKTVGTRKKLENQLAYEWKALDSFDKKIEAEAATFYKENADLQKSSYDDLNKAFQDLNKAYTLADNACNLANTLVEEKKLLLRLLKIYEYAYDNEAIEAVRDDLEKAKQEYQDFINAHATSEPQQEKNVTQDTQNGFNLEMQ